MRRNQNKKPKNSQIKAQKRRGQRTIHEYDAWKLKPQNSLAMVPCNRVGMISSRPPLRPLRFTRVGPLVHKNFTAGSAEGIQVTLGDIATPTEFIALFDEYRIMAAELLIDPDITTIDSAEQQGGLPSDPGYLELVVDYDDSSPPTSSTVLQEYETYRALKFNKKIRSVIVPRFSSQVYDSAISTAYSSKAQQWLDLGFPNVPHYGWKLKFNNSTTDVEHLFGYYQQIILHFECRSAR